MSVARQTVHFILLLTFFSGVNADAMAKPGSTGSSETCLKNNTLLQLAKSALPDLQAIDPSITLTDVRTVIAAAGVCASLEEINAALDQYRVQLIETNSTVSTSSSDPAVTNTAPSISGVPDGSVTAGNLYSFIPTASDPDLDTLRFSITNQPRWAGFDSATGTLSGTPSEADIGSYGNIIITVSDGTSTAALPGFSIEVTASTTQNPLYGQIQSYTIYLGTSQDTLSLQGSLTTGTTVSNTTSLSSSDTYSVSIVTWDSYGNNVFSTNPDVLGYRIYAGASSDSLVPVTDVASGPDTVFTIAGLIAGTYYMSVAVYDINGNVGPLSNIVKIIVM